MRLREEKKSGQRKMYREKDREKKDERKRGEREIGKERNKENQI